jgi:nucleoid-associated protein YgaU
MAKELSTKSIMAINALNDQANKSFNALLSTVSKMTLTPFEVKKDGNRIEFEAKKVIINPQSYTRNFSSGLKTVKVKDATGKQVPVKVIEFTESLSFDIWLDGTGAVPDSEDVSESIKWLINNLVKYDGTIHSTRYVKLSWASLLFEGQLKSLNIEYLFFERGGFPLRAKVSLAFDGIVNPKVKELGRQKNSPDLTHSRVVQAGDNLPLMCYKIYNNPYYYLQVAKANGLANFTNIQAGQTIFFPPLDTSNSL